MLALVLLIASWIHPGAEFTHRAFLDAVAERATSADVATQLVVFAEHESHFGLVTHGDYAPCDWGILQIHNRPDLEHDEVASVRAWLRIRARAEAACGPELALAGLASGDCHRGTKLAAARAAEAAWYLMLARAVSAN
jgi:hypothetical protein